MNTHDLVLLSRLRTVSRGEEVTGSALQAADLSFEMRGQLLRLATRISARSRQQGRPLATADVLTELLEATRCTGGLSPGETWVEPSAPCAPAPAEPGSHSVHGQGLR